MSRICALTGKRPRSGNNRPFSLKATKRIFRPNLFTRRVYNPQTGRMEKVKLSAKAIKTLKKWELAMFGPELPVEQEAGEGKHVKKEKLTPKQKKELAAAEEAQKIENAKPERVKAIESKKEA